MIIVIIAVVFGIGLSVSSISAQSQTEIPAWVKGVANFWVEGNIGDAEFGEAIAFLIEQNIIEVETPAETVNKIMHLEIDNRKLEIENEKLKKEVSYLKELLGHYHITIPRQSTPPPEPTLSKEEIDYNNYLQNSIIDENPAIHVQSSDGRNSGIYYDLLRYGLYEHANRETLRFDFSISSPTNPFDFQPENNAIKVCKAEWKICSEINKEAWKSDLYDEEIYGKVNGVLLFEFDKEDDCKVILAGYEFDLFDEGNRVYWSFNQYHDLLSRTLVIDFPLRNSFC